MKKVVTIGLILLGSCTLHKRMMRTNREMDIQRFFMQYEERFNASLQNGTIDTVSAADAFSDYFIESSPAGAICGTNDENFRKKIKEGFEFYKNIGTLSMRILNVDISALDSLHSMAKVRWRYKAKNKSGNEVVIDFDVIYMLQLHGNKVKIFAYITGDERRALQEKGLI
jgi:hypothetical protein